MRFKILKLQVPPDNHWDTFINWINVKLQSESQTEEWDEERDTNPKDLMDYLKEMKYSDNDALKMKEQVDPFYSHGFKPICDEYIQQKRQELLKNWIE